jgi:hypothetical protein
MAIVTAGFELEEAGVSGTRTEEMTRDQFYDSIVADWENGRQLARHNMCAEPTVCLMGEIDYREFREALLHKYKGVAMRDYPRTKGMEYHGIRIYTTGRAVMRIRVFGADPAE